ncbi:MAG: rhomboid family intramembrane serine protease [Lachnospiraceae bacterium]|nr:rhomboid family intramembrane serine protease [Lachnospiraceae bacterium]
MKNIKIKFNSPVVLTFAAICFGALLLSYLTGGFTNTLLFSVYRSSPASPFFYLRLIGHIFGHANWSHFFNNMLYILILGPMLEEKYGAKNMIVIIALTGIATGLVSLLFFSNQLLLGASGVVFAFILLASITSVKDGGIPLTFLLVAVIYIGGQIVDGLTVQDDVSNLTHIVGGLVGAGCGMALNGIKYK